MSPLQVAQLNPHEERFPSPEPSFHILQVSRQRSPPPGSPKRSSHRERCPILRAPFQLSLRVPVERTYPSSQPSSLCPSGLPEGSPQAELPQRKMLPFWSPPSFGFPGKGALPEAPSMEPLERGMPHPQNPFIQLSKSLVDEPFYRFPKRSPYKKRCPSPKSPLYKHTIAEDVQNIW